MIPQSFRRCPRFCLTTLAVATAAACKPAGPQREGQQQPPAGAVAAGEAGGRLPTGARLDPTGVSYPLGSMPLAIAVAPDGDRAVVLLNGWREQGVQVVDLETGEVTQTLEQRAAFVGLAFSPDGRTLYASGGNQDVVYRYSWREGEASLVDSLVLAPKSPRQNGTRYPAGLAPSPDGRLLFVAENLADSLAVVDVASGRVVQRLPTDRYPYAVAVAGSGPTGLMIYVSAWGANTVSVFEGERWRAGVSTPPPLVERTRLTVGRHPSAMLVSDNGSRLFVASGSTDRVTVVDTRANRVVAELADPPPGRGPAEGSTPNAMALSPDGTRLFVAEADNNAVAVFDLSSRTANVSAAIAREDQLVGRIPVGWYPAAVATARDALLVANGKGRGTGPNPDGPQPSRDARTPRAYTLGQTSGTLTVVRSADRLTRAELDPLSARVARANGWNVDRARRGRATYPPFEHVIYVIKENRTFDQIFGDIPEADADSTLLFFPRAVTPNHHALAQRFGVYDRFFVNAEVSADGHNWSTAAYVTDYTEKTTPSNYSDRGRSYDYEGTNRGRVPADDDDEDAAEPANGYLWDLAQRAGITFRNFGEFVVPERDMEREAERGAAGTRTSRTYRGTKPFLAAHTSPRYPPFDLSIPDQLRADVWIEELRGWTRIGSMPALQILHLPNDHTSGLEPGAPTPRAAVADNDLALGRIIEALSRTPFWKRTVVFVLEDDAQNGPDHVDSHRSPLLVVSPYSRPGVVHRFANTTDVIATITEILGLGSLSQFDYYGRPLRDVWTQTPDTTPYLSLVPAASLDERNPPRAPGTGTGRGGPSSGIDLRRQDAVDDDLFNRILWLAVKGDSVPYPGPTRMSSLEARRGW